MTMTTHVFTPDSLRGRECVLRSYCNVLRWVEGDKEQASDLQLRRDHTLLPNFLKEELDYYYLIFYVKN